MTTPRQTVIDLEPERGRRAVHDFEQMLTAIGIDKESAELVSRPDVDDFSIHLRWDGAQWRATSLSGPYSLEGMGSDSLPGAQRDGERDLSALAPTSVGRMTERSRRPDETSLESARMCPTGRARFDRRSDAV